MSKTPNISDLHDLVKQLLKRVEVLEDDNKLLRAENKQLRKENAQLKAENKKLKAENKELKSRLNSTSTNSHRPPSSDGLKKKPAFPKKKNKKRGGQFGHSGNTLEMVASPDFIEKHQATVCQCGQNLKDVFQKLESTRQVFDLPPPKLEVTQHEHYSCLCPNCGAKQLGDLPAGLAPNTSYGSGVRSLTTLLNVECKLPFGKISTLFSDLFGYQLNESTTNSTVKKGYDLLDGFERELKAALQVSELNHFDETGMRVAGKTHWLHNVSNSMLTYLFVHKNRGQKALRSEQSILPDYKGFAVHDCLPVYFKFDNCQHALCGAHLLRELQAQIEQGSKWAKTMHFFLNRIYRKSNYGKQSLEPDELEKTYQRFKAICRQADKEEPPPIKKPRGRPSRTKGRNLMERMRDKMEEVLAFAKYDFVPFTNNLAERDLRHAKVKQRVASSFRTEKGAACYARISSFVATVRKQKQHNNNDNLNIFNELKAIFDGQTFEFSF